MRGIKTGAIVAVVAIALAGCAGQFGFTAGGTAKKVGSKCYIKQTGDKYLEGRWRQVNDALVCVEEKDRP